MQIGTQVEGLDEADGQVEFWGQATLRFQFGDRVILTDPYLTDYVAEVEGPHMRRLRAPPVEPGNTGNVDWILVSHDHIDHCDPTTILPILEHNDSARVFGPSPVIENLLEAGVDANRLTAAENDWLAITDGICIHPVPACHPTIDRDPQGVPRQLGFVIEANDKRHYFAGDTSVHPELTESVHALGPIDTAFLPVNEKNFYRDRQGILGNMSIREAFSFAEEIGARRVFPIHWDMFGPNCVYPEEIKAVFERLSPSFKLLLDQEVD